MKIDKNSIVYGLSIFFWVTVGTLSFLSFVPDNPISIKKSLRTDIQTIFPQGWNFFTKNPRDNYVLVLQKIDSSYQIHRLLPNSNLNNIWGIKRNGRALGSEMGVIMKQIPKEIWRKCEGENVLHKINKDTTIVIEMNNPFDNQIICGEIAILEIEPVPWAWSTSRNFFEMPGRYIKINLLCGKK